MLLADALEHLLDELVVRLLDAGDLLFYPLRELRVQVLDHPLRLDQHLLPEVLDSIRIVIIHAGTAKIR